MKIINKNELTVLVIALMLMTAGYLDYIDKNKADVTSSEIMNNEIANQDIAELENEVAKTGDAKLVSNNEEIEIQENTNQEKMEEDISSVSTEDNDSYFVSAKLDRATMYSQTIENYQNILANQNVSQEQKAITTQEISNITQIQNSIMIAENLLLAKGFDECVIFVNDKSISVIIGRESLSQEEIAQIQNIIARELNAEVDNIHISTK